MITTSALEVAKRFIGLKEVPGTAANPQIVAMLELEDKSIQSDEVAWCSAFVNYVTFLLGLPRSKSLAARSWLLVGTPVALADAKPDCDVVIFKRAGGTEGPEVINAPGHVAFFVAELPNGIQVIGGNQGNAVSISTFPKEQLLGVRRLAK
jgi:uncharacterized protein (TIGR02594 family)